MGVTNAFIIPQYVPYVKDFLHQNSSAGDRIAWLGSLGPAGDHIYLKAVEGPGLDLEHTHTYYDLFHELEDSRHIKWDVNTKWNNVAGHNVVMAIRITYACESVALLIENISNSLRNNDRVVMDFMSGYPAAERISTGIRTTFADRGKKSNIFAFFPEYYAPKTSDGTPIIYRPNPVREDQVLTFQDFEENNLKIVNPLTLLDPIKGRYYTLAEIAFKDD